LSEELVYVSVLSFPKGTMITREFIQGKIQEIIPEDLKQTEWDFQTLSYKESEKEEFTLVQGTVIEKTFSENFRLALDESPLSIESIIPESYALACLEKGRGGVFVIIEKDREMTVFSAIENGHSLISYMKKTALLPQDLKTFLDFLASHKEKKAERLIFSHFEESELVPFQQLFHEEYDIESKDYNPLIGAGLQEKISGKDEAILNITFSPSSEKKVWWKIW